MRFYIEGLDMMLSRPLEFLFNVLIYELRKNRCSERLKGAN